VIKMGRGGEGDKDGKRREGDKDGKRSSHFFPSPLSPIFSPVPTPAADSIPLAVAFPSISFFFFLSSGRTLQIAYRLHAGNPMGRSPYRLVDPVRARFSTRS